MDRQRNRNIHSAEMRFKWREIKAEILATGLNRKNTNVAVQHYVQMEISIHHQCSS
jgi:hypothetical protein